MFMLCIFFFLMTTAPPNSYPLPLPSPFPISIQVFRNRTRLGFYRNFERCLNLIPDGVEFIAFCDQDDEWYPEKQRSKFRRSEEHTSELQSQSNLVCRLLLETKNTPYHTTISY